MKIENGLGKFFGGPIIDLLSEFRGIMEAQSFSNLNTQSKFTMYQEPTATDLELIILHTLS